MRRFFCEDIQNNTARITGDDAKHIARVLRMHAGETLSLCDGAGMEYDARITAVSPDEVLCSIGEPRPSLVESPCRVTLFQCLPKAGKFETVVQKCTELGVFAVAPVFSARCVVLPERDFEKKRVRYQRVALEAAKQSRRALVPQVSRLIPIGVIDPRAFDLFLVAYEDETTLSLKQALRKKLSPKTTGVLIGPEGGLTADEVSRLTENGAQSVSLGRRILRTETAGMALLAQLFYEVDT
ncbi:MAG TPA: RsmE family RNA methyltransferase [Eubacteriales bacterium]|nr:RsmE family RNA methyltransferase [Eubacteriales bacterium]